MFDVFVTETTTILAHGKADAVAAGLVIGAEILGVKCLYWISTFYADWHGLYALVALCRRTIS